MQKIMELVEMSTPMSSRDCQVLMQMELAEKGSIRTIFGIFDQEKVESLDPLRLLTLVQEYQVWKICRVLYRVWEKEYPMDYDSPWLLSEYFFRKMHCAARGAVCDNSLTLYFELLGLDYGMLEVFRILGTLCGSLSAETGAVSQEDIVSIQEFYGEHPRFLELLKDWRELLDSEIPENDLELVRALREDNKPLVTRLSILNSMESLGLLRLALTTHTPPVSI